MRTEWPENIQAELNILASMMKNDNALLAGMEKLKITDFSREANQLIFECIKSAYEKYQRIDIYILNNELKNKYDELKYGGYDYLTHLDDDWRNVTGAAYDTYIKHILDCSMRRKIIITCKKIENMAFDMETENITDKFMQEAIAIEVRDSKELVPISDVVNTIYDEMKKRDEGKYYQLRVSKKLPKLNWLMNGISSDTEFIIIGARPSEGKTTLLNEIAITAIQDNKRVLYFTLETSKEKLVKRLISRLSGVNRSDYEMNQGLDQFYSSAAELFNFQDLLLFDDSRLTIQQIVSKATRSVAKYSNKDIPVSLILVDYLQIIGVENKKSNRDTQVGEIASGLKGLSQTLKIPVIAAAQLSRLAAKNKPKLEHLREGGNQEAEADKVILIDNPPIVDQASDDLERMCMLEVAKNKDGKTGMVNCKFNGAKYEFEEC